MTAVPTTSSQADDHSSPLSPLPDDRRKNLRFGLHFPASAWIPSFSRNWLPCETINVGIHGATLETTITLPIESRIEYIVDFPSELTHTAAPLRVRFSGQILRVDPFPERPESYRVAVQNISYKFLRNLMNELPNLAQSDSPAGLEKEMRPRPAS